MSSSEALRMVIKVEVDESLRLNYSQYQKQHVQTNNNNNNNNNPCIFPQQIKMFPWNDIQQITQYIFQQTQIPPENQRLFFRGQEITAYNKHKRKNKHKHKPKHNNNHKLSSPTLSRLKITHESTIYLQCDIASYNLPIVSYGYCISDNNNKQLIDNCIQGYYSDLQPILSIDGEGGTYFLRDKNNKKIACFKPADEEAGCFNNPRGRTDPQQGMHCGIKPGEGHLREIAAYLLDNDHFHAVPPTMRIECAFNAHAFHYNNTLNNINGYKSYNQGIKRKIGALQKFIHGEVIENFGVKNFAIREVHKIGILDIRILNCDRNSGNVLVSRDEFGRYELIPIDHGLSLPEKIEITRDSWVWLNWKQSKQPFDPYTIEYINNIDIYGDIAKLSSELNFPVITFENMRISHLVLVKCTNMGLTLNQIGSIIARPDFDTKSILEELMIQAEILSIEKVRQNKHLINRIKLRKRHKSINAMTSRYNDDIHENKSDNNAHNAHNDKQNMAMGEIAVDEQHIVHKFIEKGKALKAPIFSTKNNGSKMCYISSLAPPNARIQSNNHNHNNNHKYQILNKNGSHNSLLFPLRLSAAPSILNTSVSLGANMSRTPNPKPLVRVEKENKNENESDSDNDNDNDNDIGYIHWTPTHTYRATSMASTSSQQSSTPKGLRFTPDTKQSKQNENKNMRFMHSSQIPQLFLETDNNNNDNNNNNNNDYVCNNVSDNEECDADATIHSPLQLRYLEKTSSIHDREERDEHERDDRDDNNDHNKYTIFKTISSNDIVKDKPGINEIEDNYDKTNSFFSLKIDSLASNKNNNNKNNNNHKNNEKKAPTSDMLGLARSISCIDVHKPSTLSLDSNHNNNHENKKYDFKNKLRRLSKDEDSFFLYSNPKEIKSASLINHSSMLDTRKEFLSFKSLNGEDSNNNSIEEEFGARSYSEATLAPKKDNNNNNNIDNANVNVNANANDNDNESPCNSNPHSVHTPSNQSHKSQDDNIATIASGKSRGVAFGIHPIMERMAKENHEVKKWFWYYLDQLLGIQCERISKFQRKNDNSDDIYDIDTVNGSFIWKNELRKHWIRSRLERKKLMQPLPPTNPFEHIQFDNKIHKKPILKDNKTSPIINITKNIIQSNNNTTNENTNYTTNNNNNNNNNKNTVDNKATKKKEISSNFLDLEHLEEEEDDDNDDWFGAQTNVDSDYNDYDDAYDVDDYDDESQ